MSLKVIVLLIALFAQFYQNVTQTPESSDDDKSLRMDDDQGK